MLIINRKKQKTKEKLLNQRKHFLIISSLFKTIVSPGWIHEGSSVVMILPQVHLRKPCYDFTFL